MDLKWVKDDEDPEEMKVLRIDIITIYYTTSKGSPFCTIAYNC